jgi:hypothetical protein
MKIAVAILSALLAVFAAIQSYTIAYVGTANQIPQLEGDGGGGIVFAALCLLAAILVLWRPIISMWLYGLALVVILLTGYLYEDRAMWLWGAAALVLGILSWVAHRAWKMRRETSGLHFYR